MKAGGNRPEMAQWGECGPSIGPHTRQLTIAGPPAADLISSAGPPPLRYLHVPVRILMYTQTLKKKIG